MGSDSNLNPHYRGRRNHPAISVTGGTQQNFSQEIVAGVSGFRPSIFDLSTSLTSGRRRETWSRDPESNQFHGSGFFFFRDHNMFRLSGIAARRFSTPDPFFARRQSGVWVGRSHQEGQAVFFFASYEHNNQRGRVQHAAKRSGFPQLSPPSQAVPSTKTCPVSGWIITSVRKHSAFVRYSHKRQRFLRSARRAASRLHG